MVAPSGEQFEIRGGGYRAVVTECGASLRVLVTFVTVLVALAITGAVSARLGAARVGPAVLRLVLGGGIAMAVTYAVGRLVGTAAF